MDSIDAQIAAAQAQADKLVGRTALIRACNELNDEAVLELIAHGEDVNATDKFGRTPLHEAARHAYRDEDKALLIIEALLDAGAAVDPVEKQQGLTPMMEAAIYQAERVLSLLIARGANVNHKGKDRKTVLGAITATPSMMRGRAKVIKILEEAGGTGRKK